MSGETAERFGVTAVLVSGFLGSGKTTLVRRLLSHAQSRGLRMAVVSNELGALGIDKAMLGDGQAAYVELEGGCVCCQLSNELLDTLQELRERADPHVIVVETSGVAIPSDTQITFWREPVAKWIAEDLVVVVTNAEQIISGRELDGVFVDQVTGADLLVLNKLDLVPEATVPEAERRLREIEPEAPILRAVRCRIDPAVILPPEPGRLGRRGSAPQPHARPHRHELYRWRELTVEGGLSVEDVRERLERLGVLRVKGFVRIGGEIHAVQGVGPRVEVEPFEGPVPGDLVGRLVVIERAEGE